jgi:hypothetical protein
MSIGLVCEVQICADYVNMGNVNVRLAHPSG